MNPTIKRNLPLVFMVYMTVSWGYYYQSNSALNAYGAANFEWLFLIDGLLVLPLFCFWCIKDKQQAAIKALIMSCLVVMLGGYIIPQANQVLLPYLETGRFGLLALFLLFEVSAIVTVFLAIKTGLNNRSDPDEAIAKPISRFLGEGLIAQILMFEARIWTYVLFAKKIKNHQFNGQSHFSYHLKDGALSNKKGFIVLVLLEIPLAHVLLHYIWSPTAASVITLLTFFSLLLFIAECRSLSRRPISLDVDTLFIRYGLFAPMNLSLCNVAEVAMNQEYVPRTKHHKRYNSAGIPNVIISLKLAVGPIKKVYLGLDRPVEFIALVKSRVADNHKKYPDQH